MGTRFGRLCRTPKSSRKYVIWKSDRGYLGPRFGRGLGLIEVQGPSKSTTIPGPGSGWGLLSPRSGWSHGLVGGV